MQKRSLSCKIAFVRVLFAGGCMYIEVILKNYDQVQSFIDKLPCQLQAPSSLHDLSHSRNCHRGLHQASGVVRSLFLY